MNIGVALIQSLTTLSKTRIIQNTVMGFNQIYASVCHVNPRLIARCSSEAVQYAASPEL